MQRFVDFEHGNIRVGISDSERHHDLQYHVHWWDRFGLRADNHHRFRAFGAICAYEPVR